MFEEPEDPSNRSFFSEIISSISDVKFSHSGRYMMTRDYLSVKIWDLNMEDRPVETYQVFSLFLLKGVCLWAVYRGLSCRLFGVVHFSQRAMKMLLLPVLSVWVYYSSCLCKVYVVRLGLQGNLILLLNFNTGHLVCCFVYRRSVGWSRASEHSQQRMYSR